MAFLQRHRFPSLWTPKQVPTGPVGVELAHPLAPTALYLPGVSGGLADLCGNGPQLAMQASSGAAFTSTPAGPALMAQGNKAGVTAPANAALKFASSGTIVWFGSVPPNPNGLNLSAICGVVYDAAEDYPYDVYTIGCPTTQNNIGFAYNSGGIWTSTNWGISSANWPRDNLAHMIAVTFAYSGNIIGYLDGVQIGTPAAWNSATAPNFGTAPVLCVGGDIANASNWAYTNTVAAYFYNQPLTAKQIAWLASDPFAMVKPKTRRTFSAPAARYTTSINETVGITPVVAAQQSNQASALDQIAPSLFVAASTGTATTATASASIVLAASASFVQVGLATLQSTISLQFAIVAEVVDAVGSASLSLWTLSRAAQSVDFQARALLPIAPIWLLAVEQDDTANTTNTIAPTAVIAATNQPLPFQIAPTAVVSAAQVDAASVFGAIFACPITAGSFTLGSSVLGGSDDLGGQPLTGWGAFFAVEQDNIATLNESIAVTNSGAAGQVNAASAALTIAPAAISNVGLYGSSATATPRMAPATIVAAQQEDDAFGVAALFSQLGGQASGYGAVVQAGQYDVASLASTITPSAAAAAGQYDAASLTRAIAPTAIFSAYTATGGAATLAITPSLAGAAAQTNPAAAQSAIVLGAPSIAAQQAAATAAPSLAPAAAVAVGQTNSASGLAVLAPASQASGAGQGQASLLLPIVLIASSVTHQEDDAFGVAALFAAPATAGLFGLGFSQLGGQDDLGGSLPSGYGAVVQAGQYDQGALSAAVIPSFAITSTQISATIASTVVSLSCSGSGNALATGIGRAAIAFSATGAVSPAAAGIASFAISSSASASGAVVSTGAMVIPIKAFLHRRSRGVPVPVLKRGVCDPPATAVG